MSHDVEFDVMMAKDVPTEGSAIPIAVVRGHVEGALPNGSFVEKCNSNEGDSYPDGTLGMVISSLIADDGGLGYQVVFACEHPLPTFISEERIRAALHPLQAQQSAQSPPEPT